MDIFVVTISVKVFARERGRLKGQKERKRLTKRTISN